MFSSVDVHNRLQELDIPHEIFKLSGQAGSIERAAAALGLELHQLARVEVLKADGEPIMAIVPGDRCVDEEKLKTVIGCNEVEQVQQDEVASITGFRGSALPPVGLKTELPAYIDYYTLKEDVIYTGSGEPTAILKIRSYDLVRATGGETVDMASPLERGPETGA